MCLAAVSHACHLQCRIERHSLSCLPPTMTYPAAQSLMPVIYNDVSSNSLSCRKSAMGYLLAEPVMPVFCSDVCSSTDVHAENLQ